jgi:hypothetical protein
MIPVNIPSIKRTLPHKLTHFIHTPPYNPPKKVKAEVVVDGKTLSILSDLACTEKCNFNYKG